jgi:hypothetical protein
VLAFFQYDTVSATTDLSLSYRSADIRYRQSEISTIVSTTKADRPRPNRSHLPVQLDRLRCGGRYFLYCSSTKTPACGLPMVIFVVIVAAVTFVPLQLAATYFVENYAKYFAVDTRRFLERPFDQIDFGTAPFDDKNVVIH